MEEKEGLEFAFSEEEVLSAIRFYAPDKVRRPDGLTMTFY